MEYVQKEYLVTAQFSEPWIEKHQWINTEPFSSQIKEKVHLQTTGNNKLISNKGSYRKKWG